MSLKLTAAYKTDVGKQREQNEDKPYSFITEEGDSGLFIVADGMGGYQAGEVASRLAVEKISESLKPFFLPLSEQPTIKLTPLSEQETVKIQAMEPPSQIASQEPSSAAAAPQKTRKLPETSVAKNVEEGLKGAIQQANKAILNYGEAQSSARGLGCTVTAALVQGNTAYVANIGDSRTYLFRKGELTPLTRDHSLVARLVEAKQIEPEDVYTHPQRNLIYKSLGAGHKSVDPDIFHEHLQPGDILLLCSDGLWEMVHPSDLARVLGEQQDPQKACDILIDMANANGGEDNITAVIVHIS
ncbi:MAG TPA: PP2C family serine/threonine-protein phosphatase [Ktedonobacteraceae bacterium]|nr:PP2C family serine/threonine-protein phosphatase [Ktedonobacteraceae bacterium]